MSKKKLFQKLIEGAGDMSQPGGKGKFRAGQSQRRHGSSTTAGDAIVILATVFS